METLIDVELLESSEEDPISLMKYDHPTVIDIDDINAKIEDPGYILDETLEACSTSEDEEKEVYTSSYRKQSFTLPVSFFDINRNINLLEKCRPISIKIVDCEIYPWYYKKIKHSINNNNRICKDYEQVNKQTHNHCTTDKVSMKYTNIEDSYSSTSGIDFSKINLSSKQTSLVLKLKEDIQAYVKELSQNVIDVDKEITSLDNHDDNIQIIETQSTCMPEPSPVVSNSTTKNRFDKAIDPNDLLMYKTIAQAIVRNPDHSEIKTNDKNVCVFEPQLKNTTVDLKIINAQDIEREKHNKRFFCCRRKEMGDLKSKRKEKDGFKSKEIIASPILPCYKSLKEAKQKNNILRAPAKVNNNLEKCQNYNKHCDVFMSSSNKTVIPHYHYRVPIAAINNNILTMTGNEKYPQRVIHKDAKWHSHQYINNDDTLSGISNLIPTHNSLGRQSVSSNRFGELTNMDIIKNTYNNYVLSCKQIEKQQSFKDINSNSTPLSGQQSASSNSLGGLKNMDIMKNTYDNYLLSCKQIEKQQAFTDINSKNTLVSGYNYGYPTSLSYQSNRIHQRCGFPRAVSNMKKIIQSNPLLTQLLDTKSFNDIYQSAVKQRSGVTSGPNIARNLHPVLGQNYGLPARSTLPSYEHNLSSETLACNNFFQHTNTGIHSQNTLNYKGTNLVTCSGDFTSTRSIINTSEQPLTKEYSGMKNNNFEKPKATRPMLSKFGCLEGNATVYKELQNINHDFYVSCPSTDKKDLMTRNLSTKFNTHNLPRFSTASSECNTTLSNNHIFQTLSAVLNDNKTAPLNSKVNEYRCVSNEEKSTKNIFNPIDIKFQTGASKPYDNTLQLPIVTSEQVDSKNNVCSSSILPIPSYKKSLEMLSELENRFSRYGPQNNNLQHETYNNASNIGKPYEHKGVLGKRKLNYEEQNYITTKRISLQEYQLRIYENGPPLK